MALDFLKILLPAALAFSVGIAITPFVTHYLYRFRVWKHTGGKIALDGKPAEIRNRLHADRDVRVPRMGGIIIWLSATMVIVGLWLLARLTEADIFVKLDFLSRDQTWIPLFTLLVGAGVGAIDDILEIAGSKRAYSGGIPFRKRLLIIGAVAFFVGWWLYAKLDVSSIGIPWYGVVDFGIVLIPVFIAVTWAIYAGGIIDGIDGLAGGVFAAIFSAYAGIAFFQEQVNLAAFCATIVGGILAFLWFNIPPARFYMTETGSMALTLTLAVVAFMTDQLGGGLGVGVLPLVALPLVLTVLSVVLQLLSKRFRGKKVFLVSPLHHHFEAIGWPAYKVTMRYWVLAAICALLGLIVALIG